ncbi:MAG: MarR family winged helix-turn-helix transcriptional regulator [Tractidigestivibacter sp.]|jgi:DNA-binding MarR family transcriptional regulator|uniref:MarR family winged helix-turn-helix transcriptional regulator n=1 Tax=Tractidigestivibacter sp. TaxID=2847320 RepID=UPI003D8CB147
MKETGNHSGGEFPIETDPEIQEIATRLFYNFGVLSRGPMKKIEGATRGEMAMLGAIYSEKREVSPKELSAMLGISTARVANTLNSLEKKGFVIRELDPSDRRRITVTLTDEGKEFFVANHREAISGLCQLVRDLGVDDAREYVRISERMVALITQRDGVEIPVFPGVV